MRSDGMIWVSLVMVVVIFVLWWWLFNDVMKEVNKVYEVMNVSMVKGFK